MKTCSRCKGSKDLTEFGMRGGKQAHLYKSWCKLCVSTHNAARNMERYYNEPGYKERTYQYRRDNPDKVKEYKR